MLLLLVFYLICGSVLGNYCEPRWLRYQSNCYKRLEADPSVRAQACRHFGSQLLETVTAQETEFVKNITEGGPMGIERGDFICKKAAAKSPYVIERKRPLPREEIDCAGKKGWYGLKSTNKCYAKFYSRAPITWTEANDRCKNLFGGTLAMMKSELEYNHVINVGHTGTSGIFYEQPMIGLRKYGNTWKWVDGSVDGFMLFHAGEPDVVGSACAQLSTDPMITYKLQTLYEGVYGRINDNSCEMLLPYFICSANQPAFVNRFRTTTTTHKPTTTALKPTTTTKPPTTTTTSGPKIYCEPRYVYADGFCYRVRYSAVFQFLFYFFPAVSSYNLMISNADCGIINAEEYEIPANTNIEYLKKARDANGTESELLTICRKQASSTPLYGARKLPVPKSDFNCFQPHWFGFNETGYCYKLFRLPEEFLLIDDARQICKENHGVLSGMDVEEMEFLTRLAHLGSPAFPEDFPYFHFYHESAEESILVSDFLIQPISTELGTPDYAWSPFVPYFICKTEYDVMKKMYSPDTSPVTCPSTSTQQPDQTCVCDSEYKDILDTQLPTKIKYDPGMYCIANSPCSNVTQPMDFIMLMEENIFYYLDLESMIDFFADLEKSFPNPRKTVEIFYEEDDWESYEWDGKYPHDNDEAFTTGDGHVISRTLEIIEEIPLVDPLVIWFVTEDPHTVAMREETSTLVSELKLKSRVMVVQVGETLYGSRFRQKEWASKPDYFFDFVQPSDELGEDHRNDLLMRICNP